MPDLNETPVVTCFLRHRGEVLLLRRSEGVGSYAGKWGAVAGHAEDDPDAAAWQEIDEETGLADAATLVRRGGSLAVEDEALGTRWIVHPYLFDCEHRDARLDWESTEAAWVAPTEILRRDTVPELWASYAQVAPSVETIRTDLMHGAAYLSVRALEVLRDWAGRLGWKQRKGHLPAEKAGATLRALAHQLLEARPAMAALQTRVNRVMDTCREDFSAGALEQAAHAAIGQALEADEEAARKATEHVAGRRVLTLSRSGTVLDALRQADPAPQVFVAASWPGGEGIGTAEALAEAGLEAMLLPDAALAYALAEHGVELVLTGADTVLPSGSVVNKAGTYLAALAAHHADVPFYAACATDKISPDDTAALEEDDPEAVYDGPAPLDVLNPLFEETPAALVTGLVTERGVLAPEDAQGVAEELHRLADWQ